MLIIQDKFSYFSLKPYVVTPHLNHLVQTVKMRGHNICLKPELKKKLSLNTPSYLELSFASLT